MKHASIHCVFTRMSSTLLMPAIALSIMCCSSCSKFIEVDPPPVSLTSDNVYADDATAISVFTGIYATLGNFSPIRGETFNSTSVIAGLAADELTLHGGAANANTKLVEYYTNRLTPGPSGSVLRSIWNNLYSKLYIVNLALERLEKSASLTPAVQRQLMGEAKFLRALFYFYLVNLYGDVPLALGSDYRINAQLSRTQGAEVYQQIIHDLTEAVTLLSDNYVAADARSSTQERVRPNSWCAAALLARVYLYTNNWAQAESVATAVINHTQLYVMTSVSEVFLRNSREAIWQLQPVNAGWNTEDARIFVLPSTGPTSNSTVAGNPVYLSELLYNAFDPNDSRFNNWIGSATVNGITYHFPFKYKSALLNAPVTEYLTVFRLAEQYLIRAEARARQEDLDGGKADLNIIRARAGLPPVSAINSPDLNNAIWQERRLELFTEWGHRWLDLKRSATIDDIMPSVAAFKATTWNTNWQWFPIPLYDIIQNPNLVQNAGY